MSYKNVISEYDARPSGDYKEAIEEAVYKNEIEKKYKSKSTPRNISLFNKKQTTSQKLNTTLKKKSKNTFYNNQYSFKNNTLQRCNNDNETSKFNNKLNPRGINNDIFSYGLLNDVNKHESYCVNCGNYGHVQLQCSEPNISLGVIAIRYNKNIDDHEFLSLMRRNSHGYCDLIRGKYTIHDIEHIKRLLEETTLHEREMILEHNFDTNWIFLWGETNPVLKKLTNLHKLREMFNDLKYNELYSLTEVIKSLKSQWCEPEWGFPKGQRHGIEKNVDTAFREFSEETGYSPRDTISISNLMPLQELFVGSNNKEYKQLYYVCFMDLEKTQGTIHFQKDEIGNALWLTYAGVLEKIRYYDKEKLKLIKNVYTMVKECDFVYI